MLSCIIIEDQVPAQRILKKYIDDLGTLTLKNTFSDALKAIEFLRVEPVDLIFLDIHLPKISGFDFLNLLPYTSSHHFNHWLFPTMLCKVMNIR